MIHKVQAVIRNTILKLDLDDALAPNTVRAILSKLPISVAIHAWGEELYTDALPVDAGAENQKPLVNKMDVAYWPPGHAICLFFGPTPIEKKGEIRPYSPVNVIGTMSKNAVFPSGADGSKATFRLS